MYIKWAWFSVKRNLKRISFYLMLVALILTYVIMSDIEKRHEDELRVLLYSESKTGDEVIGRLLELENNGITYEIAKSVEEINTDVIKAEAVCGVIFEKSLDEAISDNLPDRDIKLVMPSDSVNGYVIKEVIYPYVMQAMSDELLGRYLKKKAGELPESEYEALIDTYSKMLDEKSVHIVRIVETDTTNAEVIRNMSGSNGSDDVYKKDASNDVSNKGSNAIKNNGNNAGNNSGYTVTETVMSIVLVILTIISFFETYKNDKYFLKSFGKVKRIMLTLEGTMITAIMLIAVHIILIIY